MSRFTNLTILRKKQLVKRTSGRGWLSCLIAIAGSLWLAGPAIAQPPPESVGLTPHPQAVDSARQDTPVETIQPELSQPSKARSQSMYGWIKCHLTFFKLRYCFVAQNAHNCEIFYGLIQDNPFIGRASVDFQSFNGCDCHGVAQVTHNPHSGGNAGQTGYIKVKCSDGRTMKGTFTTLSLTTGYATVTDNLGNEFQCTFGHTAEQAITRVNELRKQLGCEQCDAKEIELKVQAQILRKH